MEKLGILIDGGDLGKVLINEFGKVKIDYRKLPERIEQAIPGSSIFRTYYFHCSTLTKMTPPTPEQNERFAKRQKFYSYARKYSSV